MKFLKVKTWVWFPRVKPGARFSWPGLLVVLFTGYASYGNHENHNYRKERDLWFRNLWFSFFFWATIMVVSCGCPADPTETSTATHDFQRILLDTIKHYDDDSFEAEVSIWLSEKVKNQIHSLAHLRRPFPFSSSENKWVQSLNNITILAIRRVIN